MAYKKILKGIPNDMDIDLQIAMGFLTRRFNAVEFEHPGLDNLIALDEKKWWVVPSVSQEEIDICLGKKCDKEEVIQKLNKLNAGILIVRQMVDNRLCVYLIDDISKIENSSDDNLILSWDAVEKIKRLSDMGIVVGDEIIGFKNFQKLGAGTSEVLSRSLYGRKI